MDDFEHEDSRLNSKVRMVDSEYEITTYIVKQGWSVMNVRISLNIEAGISILSMRIVFYVMNQR